MYMIEDKNLQLREAIAVVLKNNLNSTINLCMEFKKAFSFLVNAEVANSCSYIVYKEGRDPGWVHASTFSRVIKGRPLRIIEGRELKKIVDDVKVYEEVLDATSKG